MSKLTRKNIKVFGGNSSNTGTFGSAQAGSGVLTTDIESMQNLPAWDNGMASATIGGQKLLPQEEMEAALRVATYGLANIYQDGIPVYNSATTYYTGSIVRQDSTSILYKSITDNNTGNLLTDTGNWKSLGDLSNLTLSNLGTCSTASATAEKDVALGGFTLITGANIQVNFTNANTSSTITLNVNSTGAKNIYDLKGNQITGTYFSNAANESCIFTYDGTNWVLVTAPFWESRLSSPSSVYSDLTLGASGTTYTAPSDGWVTVDKNSTGVGQYIQIYNKVTGLIAYIQTSVSSGGQKTSLKVSKNDSYEVDYNLGGTTNLFRFIYDNGSKP